MDKYYFPETAGAILGFLAGSGFLILGTLRIFGVL